tara:strand:- start:673 stop:951 length:279 start_codon:yes stop_codon:yes gene_type:complete
MANAMSGSFVSRTKSIDFVNMYSTFVGSVTDAILETTGSNFNTAFTVYGKGYELKGHEGGATMTGGFESGSLYPIKLSYVSASSNAKVNLFR